MPAAAAITSPDPAGFRPGSGAASADPDHAPRRRLHGLCAERQAGLKLRAALIAHVGGSPSAVQLALIDALAELKVKIAVFDARFIAEGGMSPHARREYLAFANSYSRLLRQLGLKAAPAPAPSLAEHLARRAQEAASRPASAPPPPATARSVPMAPTMEAAHADRN